MSLRRGSKVWRAHRSALGFRALIIAAGLLACGGSGSDSTGPGGGGGGGGSGGAASVVITPSAPAVNVGTQVSLTAQVLDASGGVIGGATIFWSSADTTIATVSSIGVVTGKAVGSTQIAASSGGKSAAVVVTVSPVPVSSIVVLPSAVTLVINGSVTLAAVASDANGNTLTGRTVTWASSAPSVATVDGSGKVTGVTAGTDTISATCEGKTARSTVTVTLIPVASVSIIPSSAALNVGQSISLTAVTTDSHGNVLGGRPITWTTGNAAVATVSNAGLVSAIGAGTTTVTASVEGKSGSIQAVVTSVAPPPPIPVASVTVSPPPTSLNPGGTVTLSATVRDSTGAVLTGRFVTWSTSASSVATVSTSGVVTAVAPGAATITATCETKSGSATVSVVLPTTPVASVAITPSSATMVQDSTLTFTATPLDAGGHPLTGRTVRWASHPATVATVDSLSGLVTASPTATGNAGITATSEGVAGVSVVTVILKPVATVTVAPAAVTVIVGNTTTLIDTARDGHGGILTGRAVSWTLSNTTVASLASGSGTSPGSMVVTARTVGTDTVTATSEEQSGISVITVAPVPVASVTVSPSSASIVVGDSVQLNATPKDSQGNTLPNPVTWASADPTKATVSTSGWVKGVAPGPSVTITATSGGQHGTASVSVMADLAVSVTVTPPNSTITQGSTTQMTATAKDASNATLTGHAVVWSSSKPSVASVDQNSGLVTALDSGSAIISAKVDTATGSTTLTVNLVPVDSVHLTASPDSAITTPGGTVTVTAQAFDAGGNQLSGRAYTWTSSVPATATVTATGSTVTVTGVPGSTPGPVTITVTCDGTQNTVIINVSGQ